METKARYALIGLFTLSVIAAGFGFVYWLQTTGGLGARAAYRIRFENSVSGLLVGSGVLFNGIRVGEVTSLQLNPQNPREVTAMVAVDPAAPVKSDTRVAMDFQGLTGAPVIMLTGGSPSAAPLVPAKGEMPTLVAEAGTGQSLSQAARETLRRFDAIMGDNAGSLHEVINNFSTFSQALARNSDRIDGIVAGLERMTGGAAAKAKAPIYDLNAARDLPPCTAVAQGQLVIPEPTALMALNTDKLLLSKSPGESASLEAAQWGDNLPILVQAKLIESFENSGCFRSVIRPLEGLEVDYQLLMEIRNFRIVALPKPEAVVELAARLIAGKGRVVAMRTFHEKVAANATDPPVAVAALNEAFGKAAAAIVTFTSNALASQAEPKRRSP
jgi:phospholipid/cholesterol/gamma-HCH transport system substrate-binding protein